jgi:hypothetical protein
MKELNNISGQRFYYSTIEQLKERCSQKEKCTIIIDEEHLKELLIPGMDIIGKCVDQIIIISENVDTALAQLKDENLLLLSADNFESAVRFAILGSGFLHDVICILEEDEKSASEILKAVKT